MPPSAPKDTSANGHSVGIDAHIPPVDIRRGETARSPSSGQIQAFAQVKSINREKRFQLVPIRNAN